MIVHEIKTKYDVDDLVIGFPNKLPKLLHIDRIEISFERFSKDNPNFTRYKVYYLATPVNKIGSQTSYCENELFLKEELIEEMNQFLADL